MVELMNSSFIPKKEFKKKDNGSGPKISIFFLIALIIFLTTIVMSVGVYLWEKDLVVKNKQADKALTNNRDSLGIDVIQELVVLDNRINSAKEILKNHYNIIHIFDFLEETTLGDESGEITLYELSVSEKENFISVEAKGKALDLIDIQLQSKKYVDEPNISNLFLSGITKSNRGAHWEFNLSFDMDKRFLFEK